MQVNARCSSAKFEAVSVKELGYSDLAQQLPI